MTEDELRARIARLRELLDELEETEKDFKHLFRAYLETRPAKETRH